MAEQGAPLNDHAALIVKDMRAHAASKGQMTPKMDQFLSEFEISLRNRFALSDDQGKAMRELFTYRKDAAKKLTDNILDIGQKASQHELDMYRTAEQFKLDTAKQAVGINLQNLGLIEEGKAGWSRFWTIASNFLKGCGLEGPAKWCQDQADLNAPKTLTSNNAQIDALKAGVKIDTASPIGRAIGVFTTAQLSLDPNVAGVGAQAGADAHTGLDAARRANSDNAPAHVPNMPRVGDAPPTSAPAPAAAASAGSVEQMTTQILKRIAVDAKLSDDMIKGIARDVVGIARSNGDKAKIDTQAEGVELGAALKKRDLSDDQTRKINKALGIPEPQPS